MTDTTDKDKKIAELEREVTELSGLALATGVILTQLLQTSVSRELNPRGVAQKIMDNARDGIKGFAAETGAKDAMTERALKAVEQYEEQITSVLRI